VPQTLYNTTLIILSLLSLSGYLVLWFIVFRSRLTNDSPLQSKKLALFSLPLLFIHSVLLVLLIVRDTGIYLGLVNICCLVGWLMVCMIILSSFYRPTINLSIFAFPISAGTILLVNIFPSQSTPITNIDAFILIHMLLSLFAFSVFSISAGQAVFIASMDYQLRHKLAHSWQKSFPPLQTLESSLFENIFLGFALLSLAMTSGFLFIENIFAQHLVHKTFFSIFSWLIFGLLIFGRIKLGWRGMRAIKMTLIGYSLLFLAFLGSKFVLEILLQRS